MDEPKSPPKSFEELRDLLIRAWSRAGVSSVCELCQHKEWAVIHTEDSDGIGLPLRSGNKIRVAGKVYMAYALECTNCGNVRQFGKSVIERLGEAEEKAESVEGANSTGASKDAGEER